MGQLITQEKMGKALDWAYDKSINGVLASDTAYNLAQSYIKGNDMRKCANNLIKWQCAKCASSGFITGLPGAIFMPATLPANITSVLYIQIRMIAAIAIMGGYDVKSDKVKTAVLSCLVASSSSEVLKQFGIKVGAKLAEGIIKKIPTEVIKQINKNIGFRLVTKFGEKGAVNLGKMIPMLGGIIGGSFDAISTKTIGHIAREVFIPKQ